MLRESDSKAVTRLQLGSPSRCTVPSGQPCREAGLQHASREAGLLGSPAEKDAVCAPPPECRTVHLYIFTTKSITVHMCIHLTTSCEAGSPAERERGACLDFGVKRGTCPG